MSRQCFLGKEPFSIMRLAGICGGDITMQAAGTINNSISKILAEHL